MVAGGGDCVLRGQVGIQFLPLLYHSAFTSSSRAGARGCGLLRSRRRALMDVVAARGMTACMWRRPHKEFLASHCCP